MADIINIKNIKKDPNKKTLNTKEYHSWAFFGFKHKEDGTYTMELIQDKTTEDDHFDIAVITSELAGIPIEIMPDTQSNLEEDFRKLLEEIGIDPDGKI